MQSIERRRLYTEEMPRVKFDTTKPVWWKVLLALDGVITLKGSIFVQGSLVCSYKKVLQQNVSEHCPAVLVIGHPTTSTPWSPSLTLNIQRRLVYGVRLLQLIFSLDCNKFRYSWNHELRNHDHNEPYSEPTKFKPQKSVSLWNPL